MFVLNPRTPGKSLAWLPTDDLIPAMEIVPWAPDSGLGGFQDWESMELCCDIKALQTQEFGFVSKRSKQTEKLNQTN